MKIGGKTVFLEIVHVPRFFLFHDLLSAKENIEPFESCKASD